MAPSLNRTCIQVEKTLQAFIQKRAIAAKTIADAKGLAIFGGLKVALGCEFGIGHGIVIERFEDGSWSPPWFFTFMSVGGGTTVGAEEYDAIRVLETKEDIRLFIGPGLKPGMQLTAVIGPAGITADVRDQKLVQQNIMSRGVHFGVTFGATLIKENRAQISEFYARDVTACEILDGRVAVPDDVEDQVELLRGALDILEKEDGV